MKIVLLENIGVSDSFLEREKKKLESKGHQLFSYEKTDQFNLFLERTKDADVILLANMSLPKEVIEQASHLKMVDVAFTGVDHLPVTLLKEKGITVCNASGYATRAVAELTLSFMIQLLRKTKETETSFRHGKTKEGLIGNLLYGKTVGIVGLGAIGKQVAFLCKCFGCHVICTNPSKVQSDWIEEQVDFDTLLKRSDVVTLHCPLKEETTHLMNRDAFQKMKKSSILINTARGKIVDAQALQEALEKNLISGAAVDVFDSEPPLPEGDPLFQCPHVIMTPHIGYATVESLEERGHIVFENLYAWLEGKPMRVVK